MNFFLKSSCFIFILLSAFQVNSQTGISIPKTYLQGIEDNLVYDMSISYKDYYGSGLLVMKRNTLAEYHGIFLSKIGLKIMEFTIKEGKFEWVKLIEFMNKKAIRKIMERDFSMLMLIDLDHIEKIKKTKVKNGVEYFKVLATRKLMLEVKNERIHKEENRGGLNLTKTKITFYYGKNNTPKSVSLTHRNIDLKLELKLLDQQ